MQLIPPHSLNRWLPVGINDIEIYILGRPTQDTYPLYVLSIKRDKDRVEYFLPWCDTERDVWEFIFEEIYEFEKLLGIHDKEPEVV